jgi:integrase
MSGIRLEHGTHPLRRAAPLVLDPLQRLLSQSTHGRWPVGATGALLAALVSPPALRRSELVALDVEDLAFDASRGLLVMIRGSKTRSGAGKES